MYSNPDADDFEQHLFQVSLTFNSSFNCFVLCLHWLSSLISVNCIEIGFFFSILERKISASTQPSLAIAPSSTTTVRIGGRSSSTDNDSQEEASTVEFTEENVDTEKEEPEGKINGSIETKLLTFRDNRRSNRFF